MKILLVEDEMLIRQLLQEELTDAGFQVSEASDAAKALDAIAAEPEFELLITDIRMPGETDGWELARRAQDLIPALRVIYATGFSEGVRDLSDNERFIKKPFLYEDIAELIESLRAG